MKIGLLIIYVLAFVNLLLMANLHGKERTGKYNFFALFIRIIIELVLIWWALGWNFI